MSAARGAASGPEVDGATGWRSWRRWFVRARPADPPSIAAPPVALVSPVPRYPPVDPGLPAVSVDAVLATQPELLARLCTASGLDGADAQLHVLAPVRAFARHVHLLPASSHEHFAGAGGLFRFGLELAWHTRQAAALRRPGGDRTGAARRHDEQRWRHVCLLAGLLSEVGPVLAQLAVADEDGRVWPQHLGPLVDWLSDRSGDRYHVGWLDGPGPGAPPLAVASLVPAATLSWLDDGGAAGTRRLSAAVQGVGVGDAADIVALVAAARCRVVAADAATRASRYGQLSIGHHLELHLLDAIRARVASGAWVCGRAPLWFGLDGLFLEWPTAAAVLCDDLHRHGLRGVPRCAFTLADVLGRAGVLVPSSPDPWLWRLDGVAGRDTRPPPAALKFVDPRAVLGYVDADPAGTAFGATGDLIPLAADTDGVARGDDVSPPSPCSAEDGDVSPPDPASPALSEDERRMFAVWRRCVDAHRGDLVAWLPGRGLAVSQDLLRLSGDSLATVATRLHRRRWLGRGDWPSRDARAGLLSFGGVAKPGLVLNEDALRQLGWGRPSR